MEWQEQLNDFMIIGGSVASNSPIIVKAFCLNTRCMRGKSQAMETGKNENSET